MSKLKTLAGETVLYGLGNIVPRTIGFLMVSLHTSRFFPAEYGRFTQVSVAIAFFNIIYTFGLETAYFRFSNKTGAEPKKVFNQVQSLVLAISLPMSLIFMLFNKPIATAFNIGGHPEFIIMVSGLMLIDAAVAIPFARLRFEKKPLKYASAKLINIGAIVLLNYYFLKVNYDPSIGIGFIFIANLIANGIYLLFFAPELFSWRPSFDRKLSTALLEYGWPIMLGGLAYVINEMFSRGMLKRLLPQDFYGPDSREKALGIFGACYRYATIMNLAIQAFRYAAEPFFFSNATDKNSPALFARINHYFVIVCCVILLGVSINLDVLKYFLGKQDYWAGISIVPVLLLAYLFLGVYYNFSVWYKLTDKTYFGTILFGCGAILTVVLNFLMIPVWGYMGSSWATCIVYFVMAASCYLIGQKYFPVPYQILNGLAYIVITVVIIYGVTQIHIVDLFWSFVFHLAVVTVCMLAVVLIERRRPRKIPA